MTLRLFFATCATSRTINAQQSTLLSCHESGEINHKLCTYFVKLCQILAFLFENRIYENFHLMNVIRQRNAYHLLTSPKGFSASKCDAGNWIFSKLGFFEKFFGNLLETIWKLFGNSLEILWIFWGLFLDFFWRIFF